MRESSFVRVGGGWTRRSLLWGSALSGLPGLGQSVMVQGANVQGVEYFRRSRLPKFAESIYDPLGDRLEIAGRERQIFTGSFRVGTGAATVSRIIWEFPGRLRFERTSGRNLVANSNRLALNAQQNTHTQEEADLVESFLHDRLETAVINLANGSGTRFIGTRIRGSADRGRTYNGPLFDILDITASLDARATTAQRTKRYVFDSNTGLLQRVMYRDMREGREVAIATLYSGWTKQGGYFAPGLVERRQDGVNVFSFQVSGSAVVAMAADGIFNQA
ncbi:MAG: hypothetical protein ACK50U_10405 [Acidobacteriota bacterium]